MQSKKTFLLFFGLFSICGLSLSQECKRELQVNVDFPGSDLKFVYAADVHHCQLLCTQHAGCRFFTFLRSDWSKDYGDFQCYLKSTESGQPKSKTPLLGVTSGFSLQSCSPALDACIARVYDGLDFRGADYSSLFTSDYRECQRACTHDHGCQFFTFVERRFSNEKIRYKCHLKFSWALPILEIIRSTPGITAGFSTRQLEMTTSKTVCTPKMFPSTDIPGQDLSRLLAVSPEHCERLCAAHPRCTYFSYVTTIPGKMFHCYLKRNTDQMVAVAKEGVISGIPARHCQPDNSWMNKNFEGLDFYGADIRSVQRDNALSCKNACNEDSNCQFYSYATNDFHDPFTWRRCFLKRTITAPSPPKVMHLANVVSGFSLRTCPIAVADSHV